MKKLIAVIICTLFLLSAFGCSEVSRQDSDKVQIVTTIFPLYDFARQVGGEKVQVTLLLPTGAEVHSYEPTPKDIIKIKESDLFLKLGDEAWATSLINDADSKKLSVLTAMDFVTLLSEDHEHPDLSSIVHVDPHIWTTPENARLISESICEKLCEIDGGNAEYYKENTEKYADELKKLDEKFTELTRGEKRKLVFADQFPFRYFADAYSVEYYAAFPGCSSESEPSAASVATLIDTVKKEKIPVVFYTETSNRQLADTVCEETGAEKMLFHSCHSVTKKELKDGITYIDLMEKNYEALKKAI